MAISPWKIAQFVLLTRIPVLPRGIRRASGTRVRHDVSDSYPRFRSRYISSYLIRFAESS
jgi:hypothetical protein